MLIHYGEVVDDADEMAMIDHEERVYLVLAEHLLYRGELGIGADGLGICRHGLTDSDIDKVGSRTFYGTADVTVGDDAFQISLLVNNEAFGNPISIAESFELSLNVLIEGIKTLEEK